MSGSSQGGGTNPPIGPDEPDVPNRDYVLCDEDFCTSQGQWTVKNVNLGTLTRVWKQDSEYGMKASAFFNSKKYEAESWLISPAYDLTGTETAFLRHDER